MERVGRKIQQTKRELNTGNHASSMLDINTPRGQVSLMYEKKMLLKLKANWNKITFIETNKLFDPVCDGFLVKNDLVGLYESKCRNLTHTQLLNFGSWLVTLEKIEKCRLLSEYLRVPFLGFLYLIPEDKILMWKITDEKGKYLFDFKSERTETQKTINGGQAYRINAFLPVQYARTIT